MDFLLDAPALPRYSSAFGPDKVKPARTCFRIQHNNQE